MNTGFAGVCRNRQSLQELAEIGGSLSRNVKKTGSGRQHFGRVIFAALAAFCNNAAMMDLRLASAGETNKNKSNQPNT
jgi:hypothetical protein